MNKKIMFLRIGLATIMVGLVMWAGSSFAANDKDEADQDKQNISDDTTVYHCPVCDTDFLTMEEWENYVDLNHPKDKQKHKPEEVKWGERKEEKKRKGKLIYHCAVCDSDFITEQEWKNYMKLNYPEVDVNRNRPKMMWKSQDEAKEEMTPKEMYYCDVCKSGFITLKEWEHYMELNYPDVDTSKTQPKKVPYEPKKKEE